MTRFRRHPTLLMVLTALLLVLLIACEAPQEYPAGKTDTELWERNDIRVDTEVPDQYPNGRVRDIDEAAHGEEEEGHGEEEEGH